MTQMKKSFVRILEGRRNRQPPCWAVKIILVALAVLFFLFLSARGTKNVDGHLLRKPGQGFVTDVSVYNPRCRMLTDSTKEGLSTLKKLNLKGCNLYEIPKNIRYCTNLRELDVSDNPLSTLPEELRYCTKLEILFVSSCPNIRTIPAVLGNMKSITRLGWRSGSLTSVDANAIPPNLIHLILTDNKIKSLDDPNLFKKLRHVRKLMLSHNNIESFGGHSHSVSTSTQMIQELKNLELLRLAGNQITSIPAGLWTLPKLTWLTISGNPVTDGFKSRSMSSSSGNAPPAPVIKMSDLRSTGVYLGQGASGKVEVFQWQEKPVAVKIIHGVTSDGKAEDELAVYKAVGSSGMSERVVGCLAILDDSSGGSSGSGAVSDSSESKKGVVMEQLPDNLDDFASPPTIIEVTADRWRNNLVLSPQFVLTALRDVASALYFLHTKIGVAHGDVYAHNMKVDWKTGRVYLLDFGASYFTGDYAAEAERLEVRAFGILVGELIHLLDMNEKSSRATKKKLSELRSKCLDGDVKNRPSFSQIKKDLDNF